MQIGSTFPGQIRALVRREREIGIAVGALDLAGGWVALVARYSTQFRESAKYFRCDLHLFGGAVRGRQAQAGGVAARIGAAHKCKCKKWQKVVVGGKMIKGGGGGFDGVWQLVNKVWHTFRRRRMQMFDVIQ